VKERAMQEKRRCLRFRIELPASFQAYEGQKHISIGTTIDISAIGICLLTKEKMQEGLELPLRIGLPTGEKIVIYVKTMWVRESVTFGGREYRVGLKIVDPIKGDESKFIKFCAKQMLAFFSGQGMG
jgi:hypothetical protein